MAGAIGSSSAPSGGFRLGDWLVQPTLNTLSNHVNTVHLRPKAMDVLVILAQHPKQVVSRRSIMDAAWAGEPVADSALAGVICELREALGDDPKSPSFIATIPRRGYRLIAPLTPVEEQQPGTGTARPPPQRPHWWLVLPLTLATIAVSAATALLVRHLTSPSPAPIPVGPPRIAVLPFENLGEPTDEYLAAGITEEITARLTGIQGLVVVAQESASKFARSAKSTGEIGAELGVDYLLQGTVRWQRSADGASRVRITPRLVSVADGAHLWIETYDHGLEDIFAVQGEIGHQVATHLGVTLGNGEAPSGVASPTASPFASPTSSPSS